MSFKPLPEQSSLDKIATPSARARQKPTPKKSYLLALALASSALVTGIAVTSTTQAASLGDLFSSDQSAGQKKFLSVDQAFKVSHSSKALDKGTQLSINFDITPEHYVYRDQIKLSLPAGVTAAPFSFSQSPISIDDPTFGRVPVFDQTNMVATTTLMASDGKSVDNAAVTIGWQGCAKAGLCYPPEKIKTSVTITGVPQQAAAAPASNTSTNASTNKNSTATAKNAANPTTSSATQTNIAKATVTSTGAAAAQAPSNSSAQAADATDKALNAESAGADENSIDANGANGANAALDNNEATALAADNVDGTYLEAADLNNPDLNTDNTANVNVSNPESETQKLNNQDPNSLAANNLEESDPFGLAAHPWLALGLLFLAGLGLALTPCVLPMLPIVANIVARQQNPTVKKGVILTTSYAIGVSIAYGILGAVIAVFGESLGIIGWLQNPIILISFALIFVLLALYMLGVFSIRLPYFISSKMQGLSQAGDSKLGSAGGSLAAGFLSALVVSPCVSAPLFGALLAVSTIGSPLLGFAALFMLGLGLSAPLILIGATQGKIMPKAGEWMNWVKQGFALLLFAVALLLLERVFISPMMLLVWALWFMVVATWAWSWLGKARMLTQAIGLVAGIWAATLIIGAALGNDDSLQPLASLSAAPLMMQGNGQSIATPSTHSDETITTLAQLDAITSANPKVLVDLTADWCIECRIMDKNLFTTRPVQMQDWQLVRLDITETTAESKAILARYQLFGPPTLLYYQDGQLIKKQVGEIGRQQFEQTLTALN